MHKIKHETIQLTLFTPSSFPHYFSFTFREQFLAALSFF